MKRLEAAVTVGNVRGVHGRVAARLAEIAADLRVSLLVTREEETVDCSSVLDVLAMALVHGTEVRLAVEGESAGNALNTAISILTSQDDP